MTKEGFGPGTQDAEPAVFNNERDRDMNKAVQTVTSKIEDIPKHFIKIASFGCHGSGKKGTPEYNAVFHAWSEGNIGGIKLMASPRDTCGAIWVDPLEAEGVLRDAGLIGSNKKIPDSAAAPATHGHDDTSVAALFELAQVLELMHATLERLTAAVELIATQPKTAQQDLISTFESNGFHQ